MRRLITLLASVAIVMGLGACCCPCGPAFRGFGNNNRPPIVFNPPPIVVNPPPNRPPPRDPAVVALEARGGMVVRENNNPNGPVVEVNLGFTKTTDADVMGLAAFTQLRKLRLAQNGTVHRGDGQPGLNGTAFRILAGLQRLEDLDVSGCDISDAGMKAIATLRGLKVLNISANMLSDVGMKDVAKLDQLQDLNASGMLLNGLGQNEPTDMAIKELGRLKQLRKLDLSNTQIGDLSMADFAKLPQLQELRVGHQVTDAGVTAFAGHNQLQVLALINNTKLTDAVIPTLVTMPGLRELQLTGASQKTKTQFRKGLPPGIKVK